jgi:hypothetical protein
MRSESGNEQIVMSCVDAINKGDFKTARRYVSDDLSFLGVLGRGKEQTPTSKIWSGSNLNTM